MNKARKFWKQKDIKKVLFEVEKGKRMNKTKKFGKQKDRKKVLFEVEKGFNGVSFWKNPSRHEMKSRDTKLKKKEKKLKL